MKLVKLSSRVFFNLQETTSDGPVPLCSANSVSFVAEQVSHHPPSKYLLLKTFHGLILNHIELDDLILKCIFNIDKKKSPVQILYYPVKNSYNLELSTKLLSLLLHDSIFGGNAKL